MGTHPSKQAGGTRASATPPPDVTVTEPAANADSRGVELGSPQSSAHKVGETSARTEGLFAVPKRRVEHPQETTPTPVHASIDQASKGRQYDFYQDDMAIASRIMDSHENSTESAGPNRSNTPEGASETNVSIPDPLMKNSSIPSSKQQDSADVSPAVPQAADGEDGTESPHVAKPEEAKSGLASGETAAHLPLPAEADEARVHGEENNNPPPATTAEADVTVKEDKLVPPSAASSKANGDGSSRVKPHESVLRLSDDHMMGEREDSVYSSYSAYSTDYGGHTPVNYHDAHHGHGHHGHHGHHHHGHGHHHHGHHGHGHHGHGHGHRPRRPSEDKQRWHNPEGDIRHAYAAPKLHSSVRGKSIVERKALWSELFFDLIYVGVGVVLGDELGTDVSRRGVLRFIAYFTGMFWSWFLLTAYVNLFHRKDLLHKLLFFVQALAAVGMSLNIHEQHNPSFFRGYICSVLFARLTLLGMYGLAFRADKSDISRQITRYYMLHLAITILLYIVLMFLPFNSIAQGLMWGGTLLYEIAYMMLPEMHNVKVPHPPLHLELFKERVGLFMILVLGESVLGILRPDFVQEATAYGAAALALITVFSLEMKYFDVDFSFDALEGRHALDRGNLPSILWLICHLVLLMATLLHGAAIKLVMKSAGRNDAVPEKYQWLLCGSYACIMYAMSLIPMCHGRHGGLDLRRLSLRERMFVRSLVGLFINLIPLFSHEFVSSELLALVGTLSVVLITIDLWGVALRERGAKMPQRRHRTNAMRGGRPIERISAATSMSVSSHGNPPEAASVHSILEGTSATLAAMNSIQAYAMQAAREARQGSGEIDRTRAARHHSSGHSALPPVIEADSESSGEEQQPRDVEYGPPVPPSPRRLSSHPSPIIISPMGSRSSSFYQEGSDDDVDPDEILDVVGTPVHIDIDGGAPGVTRRSRSSSVASAVYFSGIIESDTFRGFL